MPEIIVVKPANLLADPNNPRVPEEGLGQREVLLAIAKAADDEIAVLARDIVTQQSIDPSALPIVIEAKEPNRYIVLEGNRRLTAIRALENPSMFEGVFSASVFDEIRKMSTVYRTSPIANINCCLMPDAKSAEHWIDLRHTGKNGGAGVVAWGPHEKARFTARTKKKSETHTRLLDFLEEAGHLRKTERQKVPVAAFARLVRTRSVRERVGFSTDSDGVLKFKNEDTAVAGLMHIAHDLASGKVKTGHIYDLEQRNEYAANLPIASTSSKGNFPAGHSQQQSKGSNGKSPFRGQRERDRLIPQDWKVPISDPRMQRISKELRTLSLTDYPNSVAVLFRVFVELSADHYLVTKMQKTKDSIRVYGYSLKKKLTEIVEYLLKNNAISRQDAAPIRSACQNDSFLASSIISMNEYIHNFQMNPTKQNLLTAWEAFDDFIAVLWR
jgi:hypothetical protein